MPIGDCISEISLNIFEFFTVDKFGVFHRSGKRSYSGSGIFGLDNCFFTLTIKKLFSKGRVIGIFP